MSEVRVEAVGEKRESVTTIHVGLVLAEVICISAFGFELSRARSGNTLSWAYVFEWPILGVYAVYMWHRLLRDARGETKPVERSAEDDPQLDAWNRYLEDVHRNDRQPDREASAHSERERGDQ